MLKENFSLLDYFFNSLNNIKLFIYEFFNLLKEIWYYPLFTTNEHHKILISNLLISTALFLVGIKISRNISRKLAQRLNKRFDKHSTTIFEQLFYYFLVIILTLFVLDIANVPLTAFAVIGTTFAVGIGIGSQHLANNFISGIIIMIEQPIKLGDLIQIKDMTGRVSKISSRCVSLKTDEGIDVLIPNSCILQETLINWTHENNFIRNSIYFAALNNKNISFIENAIKDSMNNIKEILLTPPYEIFLIETNQSKYVFEIGFWSKHPGMLNLKNLKDKIFKELDQNCRNNEISVEYIKLNGTDL